MNAQFGTDYAELLWEMLPLFKEPWETEPSLSAGTTMICVSKGDFDVRIGMKQVGSGDVDSR